MLDPAVSDPSTSRVTSRTLAALETAVIAMCVAAGCLARFYPSTPLWLDEALSVNIASAPLDRIDDLLRHDGHPPLYYYLLHAWIDAFGQSAFAVRALSGMMGVGVLALTYVVARRVAGRGTARLSLAVMAMLPFAIRYSSEARMYEMVALLVLAGWGVADRVMRPRRGSDHASTDWRALGALWVISGALLLTHYWAMFAIASALAALAFSTWRATDSATRRRRAQVFVALTAGSIWFVPWLSAFSYQRAHTGTPWATAPRPTRILSESLVDWSGGLDPEALLLGAVLVAAALVGLTGRARGGALELGAIAPGWRWVALWMTAATLGLGALASIVVDAAFAGRYSSVVFPFFVVLVGAGLAALVHPGVRLGALVAAVLLCSGTVALALDRDRTQAGVIAQVINETAIAGDVVVVCPDQLGPAIERVVHAEGVRVLRYPDLSDATLVDWVDYEDRLASVDVAEVADRLQRLAGPNAIWLVWSGTYRIAGPQCDELAGWLNAVRPGSSPVVGADETKYFESASLIRLGAR